MKKIAIPIIATLGALSVAATALPALANPFALNGENEAQNLAMIPPVSLNATAEVDGPYIRLGDLFDGAGEHAAKPVAYAPDPGKRKTLDATWLYKVARAYGLDWRPTTKFDHSTVSRPSLIVERDEIVEAVRVALDQEGLLPEAAQITTNQRNLRVHVALGSRTDIGVSDLQVDDRTRQFSAFVEVPMGAPDAKRLRVTGRMFTMEDIPVLARNVARGDVITEDDIKWTQVRAKQVRMATVTDAADIIGKSAKRFLRAGMQIHDNDVRDPVLVEKNGIITMILKTPMMTLTAQGKALEDGALGQTVRVQNLRSRSTVLARVTDHNTVTVEPLAQAAIR